MPSDTTDTAPPPPPAEKAQVKSFLDTMRDMGDLDRSPVPREETAPKETAPKETAPKETAPKEEPKKSPVEELDSVSEDVVPTTPLDKLGQLGRKEGEPAEGEKEGEPAEGEKEGEPAEGEKEPEEDNTPRARRFKELKGENRNLKQSLADIEAEKEAVAARVAEMEAELTEFESMREDMTRYKQERAVLQLEKTDHFINEVTEPLKKIMGEAYEIGDSYADAGLKDKEIADALGLTDRRVRNRELRRLQEEYGMEPEDKDTLVELGGQIMPILARRASLFGDADKALAEVKEHQTRQMEQDKVAQAEERRKLAGDVAQKIRTKLSFVTSLEGVDLDVVQKTVSETGLASLDSANQVYSHMSGEILPALAKAYVSLQDEFDNMSDELDKLKGIEPAAGPDGTSTATESRVTAAGVKSSPAGERKSFMDSLTDGSMFGE